MKVQVKLSTGVVAKKALRTRETISKAIETTPTKASQEVLTRKEVLHRVSQEVGKANNHAQTDNDHKIIYFQESGRAS